MKRVLIVMLMLGIVAWALPALAQYEAIGSMSNGNAAALGSSGVQVAVEEPEGNAGAVGDNPIAVSEPEGVAVGTSNLAIADVELKLEDNNAAVGTSNIAQDDDNNVAGEVAMDDPKIFSKQMASGTATNTDSSNNQGQVGPVLVPVKIVNLPDTITVAQPADLSEGVVPEDSGILFVDSQRKPIGGTELNYTQNQANGSIDYSKMLTVGIEDSFKEGKQVASGSGTNTDNTVEMNQGHTVLMLPHDGGSDLNDETKQGYYIPMGPGGETTYMQANGSLDNSTNLDLVLGLDGSLNEDSKVVTGGGDLNDNSRNVNIIGEVEGGPFGEPRSDEDGGGAAFGVVMEDSPTVLGDYNPFGNEAEKGATQQIGSGNLNLAPEASKGGIALAGQTVGIEGSMNEAEKGATQQIGETNAIENSYNKDNALNNGNIAQAKDKSIAVNSGDVRSAYDGNYAESGDIKYAEKGGNYLESGDLNIAEKGGTNVLGDVNFTLGFEDSFKKNYIETTQGTEGAYSSNYFVNQVQPAAEEDGKNFDNHRSMSSKDHGSNGSAAGDNIAVVDSNIAAPGAVAGDIQGSSSVLIHVDNSSAGGGSSSGKAQSALGTWASVSDAQVDGDATSSASGGILVPGINLNVNKSALEVTLDKSEHNNTKVEQEAKGLIGLQNALATVTTNELRQSVSGMVVGDIILDNNNMSYGGNTATTTGATAVVMGQGNGVNAAAQNVVNVSNNTAQTLNPNTQIPVTISPTVGIDFSGSNFNRESFNNPPVTNGG